MADLVTRLSLEDSNFTSGIASATSSLQKMDKQAVLTKRGLNDFFKGPGVDELKAKFTGVNNILNNLEKKMSSAGTGMRQQMKAMSVAAAELEQEYRNLSAAEKQSAEGSALRQHIDELIAKSGELKDTFTDVQGAIKFASSDTAQLDALAQGVTTLSAGFQVAAGAASLFGVSEEKIAKVQQTLISIMAITNGLKTIQNALQKESNLMQFIAIAREKGLAVAMGLKNIAIKASVPATNAATTAQLANNAACNANPYIAIASAILAVVAAVTAWSAATSQATEESERLQSRSDSMAEAFDKERDELVSNIRKYEELRLKYNQNKNNLEYLTKEVYNSKEAHELFGRAIRDDIDAENLFNENREAYFNAMIYRANATAILTGALADLGNAYKAINTVMADFAAGKNQSDFNTIYNALKGQYKGGNEITALLKKYGFERKRGTGDLIYTGKGDPAEALSKLQSEVSQHYYDVVIPHYRELFNAQMEKAAEEAAKLSIKNPTSNTPTSNTPGNKSGNKNRNQEVKRTLYTEEGINAIISDTEKKQSKLNTQQKNYNSELKRTNEILAGAHAAKAELLINRNDLKGAESELEKLINIYKALGDTDAVEKTSAALTELRQNILKGPIRISTPEDADKRISELEELIKIFPKGSDEAKRFAKEIYDLKKEFQDWNEELENITKGINPGSIAALEQNLKKVEQNLEDWIKNNPATLLLTVDQKQEKEVLEKAVEDAKKELGNAKIMMEVGVSVTGWKEETRIFDYKKTDLEKFNRDIDETRNHLTELEKIKLEDVGEIEFNKTTDQIAALKKKLDELEKTKTFTELSQDVKEYKSHLYELSENLSKSTISGLRGMYDAFNKLTDPMEDAENGFEGFLNVMDSLVTMYDTVKGIIDIIKEISDTVKMLTGAQQGLNAATATGNMLKQQEANTSIENATAKHMETQASQQQALASGQEAAGKAMAQNSGMGPFGWIMGIAAAVAVLAMLAIIMAKGFAGGGIVPGNKHHGDQIYARVNSGEMILNQKQQRNLFRLLDNGGSSSTGQVQFKIKGQELVGVLNNYNSKYDKLK